MTAPEANRPQPLKMRDVAARLGVSTMTVSRAIRGEAGISEATRRRVLAEVEALGYRRNDLARDLRAGRQHQVIGLIVTNLANPFYAQLAVGVEQVASARGAGVMVASSNGELERERDLVQDMVAKKLAGLIAVPAGNDHGHFDPRVLEGTPVVLAATPPQGIDVDCVLLDDFRGTYEACRKLIGAGHTGIGFLGLPASTWAGSNATGGTRRPWTTRACRSTNATSAATAATSGWRRRPCATCWTCRTRRRP